MKSEDKKLVNEAVKYIKKYQKEFLAHWNGELKDYELHDILRSKI